MLNHSSGKQSGETTHVTKSAKNKRLNLNGGGREETPHTVKSTKNKTLKLNGIPEAGKEAGAGGRSRKIIISNALRRRAQAVIKDTSIDAESRAIIRYGLEINDPWLPELVRRIEAGETIIETIVLLKHS